MKKTIITTMPDPHGFSPDPLTDFLRSGARELIQQAVEAELSVLLEAHSGDRTEDGRARLVRHGHLPERAIITGIGAVPVKVPRVRDRGDSAEKIRFTSTILPPYLRKAKSIEELLPWLYLKGISTGDFHEALAALLGPNAAGLSSTTISRLKADWWDEYDRWQRRDLSTRRFVYIWADGVYFRPRMAEEKQCVLVLIGADEWGRKEIIGLAPSRQIATQSPAGQWTGTAKAPRVGESYCLICKGVASPMRLILPLATGLWGSGMRCARSLVPPKNSAAGFTKRAMF